MTVNKSTLRDLELSGVRLGEGVTRPTRQGRIFVPHVIKPDERGMHWKFNVGQPLREVIPGRRMLEQFLTIADGYEPIIDFAERWGMLEICRHGLPACHGECLPVKSPKLPGHYWETYGDWHRYARIMRATLRLAAGRLTDDDLEDLRGFSTLMSAPLFKTKAPKYASLQLQVVLNVLSSVSHLHPLVLPVGPERTDPVLGFQLPDGKLVLTFEGSFRIGCGLFGALVLQLLLAATRTDGLALCCACSLAYFPERRPRHDQRNYCQRCRRLGVPDKDAHRDFRKRSHPATDKG